MIVIYKGSDVLDFIKNLGYVSTGFNGEYYTPEKEMCKIDIFDDYIIYHYNEYRFKINKLKQKYK